MRSPSHDDAPIPIAPSPLDDSLALHPLPIAPYTSPSLLANIAASLPPITTDQEAALASARADGWLNNAVFGSPTSTTYSPVLFLPDPLTDITTTSEFEANSRGRAPSTPPDLLTTDVDWELPSPPSFPHFVSPALSTLDFSDEESSLSLSDYGDSNSDMSELAAEIERGMDRADAASDSGESSSSSDSDDKEMSDDDAESDWLPTVIPPTETQVLARGMALYNASAAAAAELARHWSWIG
mgnify:FL=1